MSTNLHPYRTALRRYGLASIATHQYPSDSTAIEQEAAARALVELIEAAARADERAKVAEDIARAIEDAKPSATRFWDTADAATVYALNRAAAIARQHAQPKSEEIHSADVR